MTETVASLRAVFSADSTQFNNAASAVESKMQGLAGKFSASVGGIGDKFTSLGSSITAFGAKLAPVSAMTGVMFAGGIKTASDFDSAMAEISARTGLVGDDLKKVSDYALKMGADTSFSAGQAADAFLQLLSSGQSATEAISTLPTVLDLAAASGEDLGFTADMLTDVMAAFGLKVENAAMVADVLAQAAGASSATIASLGEGFANVGPIAKQFGLDVNDTAAILALFSENGIKGAEAGTQLKSMLMNMTRPTEEVQKAWNKLGVSFYDSQGNIRDLNLVMAELDIALDKLPVEEQNELMQQLGGSYGIVGLSILRANRGFGDMTALMGQQASASKVAAKRLDSFAGKFEALKGSVETLMIKAFTPFMNDILKPLIESATVVINKIAEWAEANPGLTNTVLLLGSALIGITTASLALGPILSAIGAIIGAINWPIMLIIGAVLLLKEAWEKDFLGIRSAIEPVIETLSYIVGWLGKAYTFWAEQGGVISGVIGVFQALFYVFEDGKTTFFSKLFEALGMSKEKAQALGLAIVNLSGKFVAAVTQIALFAQSLWNALKTGDIEGIKSSLTGIFNGVKDAVIAAIPMIKLVIGQLAESFWNWVKTVGIPLLAELGLLLIDVATWIVEQIPGLVSQLAEWAGAFIDWVAPAAAELLLELPDLISDVLQWILDVAPDIAAKILEWGTTFIEWVGDAIPPLLEELGEFLGSLIEWIIGTFIPDVIKEAPGMIDAFLQFASDLVTEVGPKLLDFLEAIGEFIIEDMVPAVLGFGEDIAQGIMDGIKQGIDKLIPDLEEKINGVVDDIKGFFEDPFGISSPSTVAAGWGEAILEGLEGGLTNTLALALQMGLVVAVITAAGLLITGAGTSAGTNLVANLTAAIIAESYTISGAVGIINTYANGMAANMTSYGNYAGQMLVYGIATGIYNNISAAIAAVQYLGWTLQTVLKSALGIYSPSRVFKDLGKEVPAGFAKGIEQMKPVEMAVKAMAESTMPPATPSRNSAAPVTNNTSTVIVKIDEGVMDRRPDAGQYGGDFGAKLMEQLRKKGQGVRANG